MSEPTATENFLSQLFLWDADHFTGDFYQREVITPFVTANECIRAFRKHFLNRDPYALHMEFMMTVSPRVVDVMKDTSQNNELNFQFKMSPAYAIAVLNSI